MTVRDLIETAITHSDNSANDSLLRTVGGPEAVRRFLAKHDLGKIRFGSGERLLQRGPAGLKWQQRYSVGRAFQQAPAAPPAATRKGAMEDREGVGEGKRVDGLCVLGGSPDIKKKKKK